MKKRNLFMKWFFEPEGKIRGRGIITALVISGLLIFAFFNLENEFAVAVGLLASMASGFSVIAAIGWLVGRFFPSGG